jgi:hypothetical protein
MIDSSRRKPAGAGFGHLKTDPFARTPSLPPLGRGGRGVGCALQPQANTGNGEPVTQPTALKIPPQVPLTRGWGRRGGIAVGLTGETGSGGVQEGPSNRGRRDSSAGAAAAASGPPTLTRAGGSASGVTQSEPKARDWRDDRAGASKLQRRPGSGRGG